MKKENNISFSTSAKGKAIEIGYMVIASVGLLLSYTLFATFLMLILITIFGSFQ